MRRNLQKQKTKETRITGVLNISISPFGPRQTQFEEVVAWLENLEQ